MKILFISLVIIGFTSGGCTKFKSVDYSLHTKDAGDMGYSIQYQNFVWRFTNETKISKKGVEQSECLWQASVQNTGQDTITLQLGFRLFDKEGNLTEEVRYNSQKISYPDSIAGYFTLIPHKIRRIRGSFWIDKENALKTIDGDFFVVTTLMDTTRRDTLEIIPADSAKVTQDTAKI